MVISYRFGLSHKPFSFQLRGNSNSESGRVSMSSQLTTESRGMPHGIHTVDSRSERLTTDNYSNGE